MGKCKQFIAKNWLMLLILVFLLVVFVGGTIVQSIESKYAERVHEKLGYCKECGRKLDPKGENGEQLPSSISVTCDDARRTSKYEVFWCERIVPPMTEETVAKKIRIGDDLTSVQSALGAPTRILKRRDGTTLQYRYDFICQKPAHPLLLFQKYATPDSGSIRIEFENDKIRAWEVVSPGAIKEDGME